MLMQTDVIQHNPPTAPRVLSPRKRLEKALLSRSLARVLAVAGGIALGTSLSPAGAEIPDNTIRIAVLNDMSGPYSDLSGKASVTAAQMAAEDFAKEAGAGAPKIEILSADHQNKADIGAQIARRWVDTDGVAAIVDVPNSAVALAVNEVMRQKDRAFLASSTATSDLTGKACAPTTVQWVFDTWALANGTARTLVKQGGNTWFFLTADYAFGYALERDAGDLVKANGGRCSARRGPRSIPPTSRRTCFRPRAPAPR